jgi:hypothetical protein
LPGKELPKAYTSYSTDNLFELNKVEHNEDKGAKIILGLSSGKASG